MALESGASKNSLRGKEVIDISNSSAHYGPNEELQLSCDASPYGVKAVLSEF